MKKFDRITAILVLLQSRSVVTAQALAARFDVSERTVYRDLRTLENAGVPIGAEAGIGYFLDKSYRLPPVAFTVEEASALLFAARMVEGRIDRITQNDCANALDKIRSVLASDDREALHAMDSNTAVFQPQDPIRRVGQDRWLPECRTSLARSQVLSIQYESAESGQRSERDVEPVGLYFYSNHWHLIAWCRLRCEIRDFRLDRVQSLRLLDDRYSPGAHGTLQQHLARTSHVELTAVRVTFSADAVRFVGEQRYEFGLVHERETEHGVEMTFMTPHLPYLARWLLQFAAGAHSDDEPLRSMMQSLVSELGARWTRNRTSADPY